ncbi:MAG: FliMN protein [Parachlamydiales bacterium]|nr:FliMN protein [Parachlamydiales bacterium]
MTNGLPLAWARKVDDALRRLDKIPLYGNAPRLDISRISSAIKAQFGAPLSIETGEGTWREEKKIKESLGSDVMSLSVSISPLSGNAIWMMGREDVARMTSWLMNGKSRTRTINSEILQEGFYRFLALEALAALQTIEPITTFSLKINEESEESIENAYCIDIKLSFEHGSCWGRLVLPAHLLTSWQRHFSSMRELFSLSPLAPSIEVPLSICTGNCRLTTKEWNKLEKGDFILLERGGYDPRLRVGAATLSLGSTPLFHISVKENKIKLLDYALFYEETMEKRDAAPQKNTEETASAEEGRAMAVKELPLLVTVELARLRMSVDQLMKLSPGNFLELPIHPDQEVSLTVNGQKIGRGELVYLGEALGIRVIETA